MADAKTINTRIVLRNDDLSAWEKSEKALLKGEVAFARLSGTNDFEMRIGTGDKTWNQLSDSNVIVPDSTKFYEVTLTSQVALADKVNALSDYNATAKNGDIGVVKERIVDGKYSHTAYRWDKATNGWVALDGNYNASNVIFDEDLTYTAAIGAIAAPSGSDTLKTAGKSVEDLFKQILAKEIAGSISTKPSTSKPSFYAKVNGSGSEVAAKSYEYGTYLTDVRFAGSTFTKGTYKYGPATTQTTCTWETVGNNISVITGANSNTGTCETVVIGDKGKDTDNATLSAYTTHTTFSIKTKGSTVADTVEAYTNLGNTNTAAGFNKVQFTANYNMAYQTSNAFTGYRKMFYGSKTDVIEINNTNIRGLTGEPVKTSGTFTVSVVEGAKHVIIAVPSDRTIKKIADEGAFGTDIIGSFVPSQANITGANGYTAISYNIYEYKPDAALGKNTYTVTIG